jgi:enoyl-CoA hydratase/carnithine racemase
MRLEGLFEIKFHTPKTRNALTGTAQSVLARIIPEASADKKVKCILIHGGTYYGAGNDLAILASYGSASPAEREK